MREIDPKDVPQLMRDGKLEFGMELEFFGSPFQIMDWTSPKRLTGFCIESDYPFEGEDHWYKKARFPIPALRDGDPVVVINDDGVEHHRHFKSFLKNGGIQCYGNGLTLWTIGGNHFQNWKNWRLSEPKELWLSGYTEYQINEMMGRWGIEAAEKPKNPCSKCGGTGKVCYYHDAGDHFSAGPAPGSGWRTKPCDCQTKCVDR